MTVPAVRHPPHPKWGFPTCGARTRAGTHCAQKAGWGTDHLGTGRCKLHGGLKKGGGDRRLKSGRWSLATSNRLAEYIEDFEDESDPLNIVPELNLTRALVKDWLERYDELVEAILHWNETRAPEDRPARVPDIQEARPLIESISRIAYRIERATSDKYIPRGTFFRIMTAMGRVVESRVPDEALKEKIKDDWLRIEVP